MKDLFFLNKGFFFIDIYMLYFSQIHGFIISILTNCWVGIRRQNEGQKRERKEREKEKKKKKKLTHEGFSVWLGFFQGRRFFFGFSPFLFFWGEGGFGRGCAFVSFLYVKLT